MKTINEVNYNLVTLKCALADVEAKHGVHKRSTTGSTITTLVNKITNLVTKAEYVISDIEEMGSDAWKLMTMDCELGYLLDVANRCRFIYTARQRRRIVDSLETILTALTLQFDAVTTALTTPAVQEEAEVLEADEIMIPLEADQIITILEPKEVIEVKEEQLIEVKEVNLIEVTNEAEEVEEADEVYPALITTEALVTYVIMASYIIKRIQNPWYITTLNLIMKTHIINRLMLGYVQKTQNLIKRPVPNIMTFSANGTRGYLKKMTLLSWERQPNYSEKPSAPLNLDPTSFGGSSVTS